MRRRISYAFLGDRNYGLTRKRDTILPTVSSKLTTDESPRSRGAVGRFTPVEWKVKRMPHATEAHYRRRPFIFPKANEMPFCVIRVDSLADQPVPPQEVALRRAALHKAR